MRAILFRGLTLDTKEFVKNAPCHASREFLSNGVIGIVEALDTLDEKHGTEGK